jgi:hypothetical protein
MRDTVFNGNVQHIVFPNGYPDNVCDKWNKQIKLICITLPQKILTSIL